MTIGLLLLLAWLLVLATGWLDRRPDGPGWGQLALRLGLGLLIGPVLAAKLGLLPVLLGVLGLGLCLGWPAEWLSRKFAPATTVTAWISLGRLALLVALLLTGIASYNALHKSLETRTEYFPAALTPFTSGTVFIAPDTAAIAPRDRYDNVVVYRIPARTFVQLPNGSAWTAPEMFDLHVRLADANDGAVDLLRPSNASELMGAKISIPAGATAWRTVAPPAAAWIACAGLLIAALLAGYCGNVLRPGQRTFATWLGTCAALGAAWLALGLAQQPALANWLWQGWPLYTALALIIGLLVYLPVQWFFWPLARLLGGVALVWIILASAGVLLSQRPLTADLLYTAMPWSEALILAAIVSAGGLSSVVILQRYFTPADQEDPPVRWDVRALAWGGGVTAACVALLGAGGLTALRDVPLRDLVRHLAHAGHDLLNPATTAVLPAGWGEICGPLVQVLTYVLSFGATILVLAMFIRWLTSRYPRSRRWAIGLVVLGIWCYGAASWSVDSTLRYGALGMVLLLACVFICRPIPTINSDN